MSGQMNAQLARQVLDRLQSRQAEIEKFIQALVEVESPSGDEEGSRAVIDLLVETAGTLECVNEIDRVDVPDFGQHLVVRAFQEQSDAGKIYGPGIFDMKANCALAIEVLRALSELQANPQCAVTLALTCDEEVGSLSGWPFLEQIAKSRVTRCALVMEPPASGGRVKTGRKGTGIFAIKVEGKAAHAGLEPEKD